MVVAVNASVKSGLSWTSCSRNDFQRSNIKVKHHACALLKSGTQYGVIINNSIYHLAGVVMLIFKCPDGEFFDRLQ